MRIFRPASKLTSILLLLVSLIFAYYYNKYDYITLIISILLPLAYAILALPKQEPFFYVYLAYFISLVDDAPVYFDSVFTWPEVTGGNQHYFLEVTFHLLTLLFMLLALGKFVKPSKLFSARMATPILLIAIAFLLSYAQSLPIHGLKSLVQGDWYLLDVLEHAASVMFLAFSFYIAKKKELIAQG